LYERGKRSGELHQLQRHAEARWSPFSVYKAPMDSVSDKGKPNTVNAQDRPLIARRGVRGEMAKKRN